MLGPKTKKSSRISNEQHTSSQIPETPNQLEKLTNELIETPMLLSPQEIGFLQHHLGNRYVNELLAKGQHEMPPEPGVDDMTDPVTQGLTQVLTTGRMFKALKAQIGQCSAIIATGEKWCCLSHIPASDPGQLDDQGAAIKQMAQMPDLSKLVLVVGSTNADEIMSYVRAIDLAFELVGEGLQVYPHLGETVIVTAREGLISVKGGLKNAELKDKLQGELLELPPNELAKYPHFITWAQANGWKIHRDDSTKG